MSLSRPNQAVGVESSPYEIWIIMECFISVLLLSLSLFPLLYIWMNSRTFWRSRNTSVMNYLYKSSSPSTMESKWDEKKRKEKLQSIEHEKSTWKRQQQRWRRRTWFLGFKRWRRRKTRFDCSIVSRFNARFIRQLTRVLHYLCFDLPLS